MATSDPERRGGDTRRSLDPDLVRAITHPLRVGILDALQGRVASASGLADQLGTDVTTLSYHLRVLHKTGTVQKVRTRRVRGAVETFYTARPRSFVGHQDWRRTPRALRAGVTNEALRTFAAKLSAAIEADTIDSREDTTLNWMPITVDEQGWREVAGILERTLHELTAVAAASRRRLGEADGIPVVTGLAAFEAAPAGASPELSVGWDERDPTAGKGDENDDPGRRRSMPRTEYSELEVLGRAIRELRESAGLTQAEVAAAAGLHRTQISNLELGKNNPGWSLVTRIVQSGLGLKMVDLAEVYPER